MDARATFFFEFVTPLVNRSPQWLELQFFEYLLCQAIFNLNKSIFSFSTAMLDVWIKVLEFRLKPTICAAGKALIDFNISKGENGILIKFSGHRQKLGKIFDFFLDQFLKMGTKVTPEAYHVGKDVVLKNYYNVITAAEDLHK